MSVRTSMIESLDASGRDARHEQFVHTHSSRWTSATELRSHDITHFGLAREPAVPRRPRDARYIRSMRIRRRQATGIRHRGPADAAGLVTAVSGQRSHYRRGDLSRSDSEEPNALWGALPAG